MKLKLRFGMVLGPLTVLKITAIKLSVLLLRAVFFYVFHSKQMKK